jgi:phosphoribosyl 1,2-cyclic phosphodiesterase
VSIETVPESLEVDGCTITHMVGNHPGKSIIYRLEYEGRSIVYATDYEHDNGEFDERLVEFARGAGIFIYDGSYTPEEYEKFKTEITPATIFLGVVTVLNDKELIDLFLSQG